MPQRNLSCLRFSTDVDQLDRNRFSEYATSQYAVITPNRTMPPWQITRKQRTENLTVCKLTRISDSVEIDILTVAQANGLSLQKSGYFEQYDTSSIAAQSTGDNKYAWGWGIGDIDSGTMSKIEVKIYADDTNNLPTTFTARILDGKGGTQVLETTISNQIIPDSVNHTLYFDFGETYDNSAGDELYLEIKSDGVWSPVGKDSGYGSGADFLCSYSTTADTYPDTDATGGDIETFSGYTKAYDYLGNYDIIQYTGAVFDKWLDPGLYTCEVGDGCESWYSEYFLVKHFLEDHIKLEWYHDRPFFYSGGHLRYDNSFKHRLYFDTDLSTPEYPVEEETEKRKGHEFVHYSITYKLYKFQDILPEYISDILSTVRQHDHVYIYHNYTEYAVDKFLHTPNESYAQFSETEIEFRTDTVIVETGKGEMNSSGSVDTYKEKSIPDVTFSTYVAQKLNCIYFDYAAEDELLTSNSIYTSPSTYTGCDDDYMVFVDTGIAKLYQYDLSGPSWTLVTLTDYDVVKIKDVPEFKYWETDRLKSTTTLSTVTSLGGDSYRADGVAMPTAKVRVEMRDSGSNSTYTQWYDGKHFIDDGITFEHSDLVDARIVVEGHTSGCATFNNSSYVTPT